MQGKRAGEALDQQAKDLADGEIAGLSLAEQSRIRSRKRSQELVAAKLAEYERKRAKPEQYSGLLGLYVRLSNRVYQIVKADAFDNFIMAVITIASVMISLETYDGLEGNFVISILNGIILIIFTGEVVLKLIAQSLKPWLYFLGPQKGWPGALRGLPTTAL